MRHREASGLPKEEEIMRHREASGLLRKRMRDNEAHSASLGMVDPTTPWVYASQYTLVGEPPCLPGYTAT